MSLLFWPLSCGTMPGDFHTGKFRIIFSISSPTYLLAFSSLMVFVLTLSSCFFFSFHSLSLLSSPQLTSHALMSSLWWCAFHCIGEERTNGLTGLGRHGATANVYVCEHMVVCTTHTLRKRLFQHFSFKAVSLCVYTWLNIQNISPFQ